MVTDAEAEALGYALPVGGDFISSGDDAISQNARTSAELHEWGSFARRRLTPPENNPVDVFELGPGVYTISGASWALRVENLPEGVLSAGTITVARTPDYGWRSIRFEPSGADHYYRTITSPTDPTVMMPWQRMETSGSFAETVQRAHDNPQRKQFFLRRRGGTIGTGGVGAVALRFDHGAVNFRDIVLPLLREFDLPSGLAINPGQDRLDMDENAGVTWDEYRAWAAVDGVEPWNHGMTHGNAWRVTSLHDEIVASRDLLQQEIPGSAIEGWMAPGGGADYEGQTGSSGVGTFTDYPAGRMILASHAVGSGYGGSHVRPATGTLIDGQRHFTFDTTTSFYTLGVLLDETQDTGGALQLMLHPSQIGVAGVTASLLRTLFEWIATERDAGRLIVLSPSGLMLADASHTHRRNLARFGDFRSLGSRTWTSAWDNRTGWSRADTGGFYYLASTSGATLGQDLRYTIVDQHRGALFETSALVRSPTGGTARIGTTSLPGGLNDVSLPASETWQRIRQFSTIPLDADSSWNISVGRVDGEVHITDVRLQPV